MKIEIDIDDKYESRNIWIFAGVEPVARRYLHKGYWEKKIESCSRCGKCCEKIKEDHPLGTKDGCRYLLHSGKEKLCGLGFPQVGLWRPHGCSIADRTVPECSIRWSRYK